MYFRIQHTTTLSYSSPASEHVTELRMQPRSEGRQRCLNFRVVTSPRARISSYRDLLNNTVHHFDVPFAHYELIIAVESLVEVRPPPALPAALPEVGWEQLAAAAQRNEFYDELHPSHFARPTSLLLDLQHEFGLQAHGDPLQIVLELCRNIHHRFAYVPQSTRVDSAIDEALAARRGVCQDFSHIMIALCRQIGIPARYVSGYLFHQSSEHDRSEADATHAWVEVWLPTLGWLGLDPTNNLIAGERHIRVALGRDYADVPPTRGVYRGGGEQSLLVEVHVNQISGEELDLLIEPPPPQISAPPDSIVFEAVQQQQQ